MKLDDGTDNRKASKVQDPEIHTYRSHIQGSRNPNDT